MFDLTGKVALVTGIEADVTDEHSVARLFRELMVRHGRLDILVNNAGGTIRKASPGLLALINHR